MISNPDSPITQPAFRRVWLAGVCGGVARWLEIVVVGIYVFEITGSALLASTVVATIWALVRSRR